MDLKLDEKDGGVILPVQVTPKAKNNSVNGIHQGRLKVSITQAPEKGKANQALILVLSKILKMKKSQFTLLSGKTSTKKILHIANMKSDELRVCIETVLKSKK